MPILGAVGRRRLAGLSRSSKQICRANLLFDVQSGLAEPLDALFWVDADAAIN